MSDIEMINEYIDELTNKQIHNLLTGNVDYEESSTNKALGYLINVPIELIICYLSNKNDDNFYKPFITDIFEAHQINYLYINMIEAHNICPINKDSILLQHYKKDEDFAIYNEDNIIPDDIKSFMVKYSFEASFGFEIDFELAKLNYEKENYEAFILFETEEQPDGYERKHFMIRKFYQVWEMYLNKIPEEDKESFFENIIKKHFCYINWRAMSRLYDPNDTEFMEKFSGYLDMDFAKQYHPKFK
jgi:hypothetical protein